MPNDANDVHQQPTTTNQALRPPSGKTGEGGWLDASGTSFATFDSVVLNPACSLTRFSEFQVVDMVVMIQGY